MYMYVYIHICVCIYICIYVYIYYFIPQYKKICKVLQHTKNVIKMNKKEIKKKLDHLKLTPCTPISPSSGWSKLAAAALGTWAPWHRPHPHRRLAPGIYARSMSPRIHCTQQQ